MFKRFFQDVKKCLALIVHHPSQILSGYTHEAVGLPNGESESPPGTVHDNQGQLSYQDYSGQCYVLPDDYPLVELSRNPLQFDLRLTHHI